MRSFFARLLEVPPDVTLDLPRLSWLGDLQLMVENHQGVLSFDEREAMISTRIGVLVIWGADLRVAAVDRDAIVMTGRIEGMRYRRA